MQPRERNLFIVAGVVVLGAALFSILNPSGATAAKKGIFLPVAEAEAKRETSLKELRQINLSSGTIEPNIEKMSFNRPAEELIPRVVRDLQRIAKQSNIRLQEVKPQRSRPLTSGQGEKVPIDIRFRAPFQPNVTRFLYFVEAPEGKMAIEKFNITTGDAKTRSVDVSAQIVVFTRVLSVTTDSSGGK
ncbi:MAG: hypothetical protein H7308_18975 [Chthonomonadaceae bacterium]|nr:hypothetical protein [Chthonomonadaceae bacterium]